jgi:hypothetical protein
VSEYFFNETLITSKSGSMAELASVSAFHPRDPSSNLGGDRIFFDNVCVTIEFISVGS